MSERKSKGKAEVTEEPVVLADNVRFSYTHPETGAVLALSDVSIQMLRGSHVALLGRNGSGKSTMAKLVNVLELPQGGRVMVLGRDTLSEKDFWEIRRSCGMVFQNPDNQIVGTTVEEDVAFGPENLGFPTEEIRRRVDESLRYVGLMDLALRQPSQLSGGQKQKLAIAGVLAMSPQILLLDESTSMLDPLSRDEFLGVVDRLIKDKKMTVLHITHDMSEACLSDYIYVLEKGRVAMEGTPGAVFSQVEKVRSLGLDVPVFADLAYELAVRLSLPLPSESLISRKTALAQIRSMLLTVNSKPKKTFHLSTPIQESIPSRTILEVSHLCHAYDHKGARSLSDISFSVREGEIFAVIGHSGSGKTTLISHLNGLLRPQEGDIFVYPSSQGTALSTKRNADVKQIRRVVGLLFQYPEYQLFEETVEKDIAFGPTKMGLPPVEIHKRVKESLTLVGLDESIMQRSPFELSGGQKRRVAFAGVLAMDPDILVLDEPAAGLDPTGRREILGYAQKIKKLGKTIILVSHNMDEAARYADRILVLKNGEARALLTPQELFSNPDMLRELELCAPETVACLTELKADYPSIRPYYFTPGDAANELIRAVREHLSAAQKTSEATSLNAADAKGGRL
jgi:energy-coupling factor transporter ATPase